MEARSASKLSQPAVDLPGLGLGPRTLRINLSGYAGKLPADVGTTCLHIPLDASADGQWVTLLGGQPGPHAGALEQLASFIYSTAMLDAPPGRIELAGPAAACTLVAVWLRTIWFADVNCEICRVGEDRDDETGRNNSTFDHSMPSDRITVGLGEWWRVAAERVFAAGGGGCVSSGQLLADVLVLSDAVLGLIEHADLALAGQFKLVQDREDWRRRMRSAIERCRMSGRTRVAIYGAGTHTRAMGEVFCAPGVSILGIIDDDASRHGERLWGFEVVSMEWAMRLAGASPRKLDAVILSANAFEPALWERSAALREAGVEVIRLYA